MQSFKYRKHSYHLVGTKSELPFLRAGRPVVPEVTCFVRSDGSLAVLLTVVRPAPSRRYSWIEDLDASVFSARRDGYGVIGAAVNNGYTAGFYTIRANK